MATLIYLDKVLSRDSSLLSKTTLRRIIVLCLWAAFKLHSEQPKMSAEDYATLVGMPIDDLCQAEIFFIQDLLQWDLLIEQNYYQRYLRKVEIKYFN